MVQEFHVLRCFSCRSFQVQQVKKVNKWSCKLCGEKQSLLKEFWRGPAADCRRHVQKLNAMRGAMMEEQEHKTWSLWKQMQMEANGGNELEDKRDDQVTQTQVSCWSKYLNTPEEMEPEEEENVLMDRQRFHVNMIDRKRKRREECTDRGEQDSWTPEQSNCSSLVKTLRPSVKTTTTSLNQTSPPSLRNTSLNQTSPPSKRSIDPASVSTGRGSRWTCFLSSDSQGNEREEPSVSGCSQSLGGTTAMSCNDISNQATPITQSHPLLPVSSMFQSGEEFCFDDEFLTAEML